MPGKVRWNLSPVGWCYVVALTFALTGLCAWVVGGFSPKFVLLSAVVAVVIVGFVEARLLMPIIQKFCKKVEPEG